MNTAHTLHAPLVDALKRNVDAFEAAYKFIPAKDRKRFARLMVSRGLSQHGDDARNVLARCEQVSA